MRKTPYNVCTMSANDAGATGESEEEIWRQRLVEAERQYREAIRAFRDATESGSADVLAEAARKRDAAREEFHRVLRTFGDIVIRGKMPKF